MEGLQETPDAEGGFGAKRNVCVEMYHIACTCGVARGFRDAAFGEWGQVLGDEVNDILVFLDVFSLQASRAGRLPFHSQVPAKAMVCQRGEDEDRRRRVSGVAASQSPVCGVYHNVT